MKREEILMRIMQGNKSSDDDNYQMNAISFPGEDETIRVDYEALGNVVNASVSAFAEQHENLALTAILDGLIDELAFRVGENHNARSYADNLEAFAKSLLEEVTRCRKEVGWKVEEPEGTD